MNLSVAHIIPAYLPATFFGGPIFYVQCFIKATKQKVKNIVFTANICDGNKMNKLSSIEIIDGAIVIREPITIAYKKYYITPSIIRSILRFKELYNVIYVHGIRNYQSDIILLMRNVVKKSIVVNPHGALSYVSELGEDTLHKIQKSIIHTKLRLANAIIVSTKHEASVIVKRYKLPKSKVVVIPLFVDIDSLLNTPYYNLRERFNLYDKIIVGYVGRLNFIKGIDILLKASIKLLKEFNEVYVVIAGFDEGMGKFVRLLQTMPKYSKRVVWINRPTRIDIISVLRYSDIIVIPSRYESFGLVTLEAFTFKKPVIASNVGGLKEIITHGIDGFLFRKEDPDDLYAKIKELLKKPELIKTMSEHGFKKVKKYYNAKVIGKQLVEVLEKLAS